MVRRTSPQWKRDKEAYPVTVRILTPESGFSSIGYGDAPWSWLRTELGLSEYAETHGRGTLGDTTEFHFRTLEDAAAFLERFPKFTLADHTLCRTYSSPYVPFGRGEVDDVCNLYNLTRAQDAIRRLFADAPLADRLGNFAPMPEIYPDYHAPIVTTSTNGLDLMMGRWGMPTPPQFLMGKKADRGVTNIRNTASPHWRRWLGPEHRCLVPFDRFAEPSREGNVWFALHEERPGFFAGLWTRWTSVRKVRDGETTDDLYGFLTTTPNADVAPVHPKAMPVILTEPEEWETWLAAPWSQAARLQRPLCDGVLVVV